MGAGRRRGKQTPYNFDSQAKQISPLEEACGTGPLFS